MKYRLFKVISLLIAGIMILGFAGCGDKPNETTSSENSDLLLEFEDETGSGIQGNNDDASTGSQAQTSGSVGKNTIATDGSEKVDLSGNDPFANIPKNLKGTTVVFANFGDEGSTEYKKVLNAFTKKTGIKVELVTYDQETYISTVSKQIATKSPPDIIICNDEFPQCLEIAQPLQNLIDLKDSFWDEQITKLTTINGNTYFVNSRKSVWQNVDMIFYDKTLFTNNKIPTPAQYYENGTWSYENMRKCMEKLSLIDGVSAGYVMPDMMAASIGSPVVEYDPETTTFKQNLNSAAEAFKFQAQNVSDKLWDPGAWFGQLGNGTVGLYMHTAYGCKYNGWFKDSNTSVIEAVPMPTTYNGKPCKQSADLRCYGIAKNSKNPMGAAYLLRYFLDYDYYEAAGANVFINKNVKTVYFDQVLARGKEEGINYYFSNPAMKFTNLTQSKLIEVSTLSPAQVSGTLSSYANQFDSAVKKMNEKIAAVK